MPIRSALPAFTSGDDVSTYRSVPQGRRWAVAGLALGAVLILGACSDKQEPTVASAAEPGAAAPAETTAEAAGTKAELAEYVKGQREWVACLRKQGYPNVPDPDENGDVELIVEYPTDTTGKGERKLAKASNACKQFSHEMSEELAASLDPPLTPVQVTAQKKFSECMRRNGVSGYPDPGPDGRFDSAGNKLEAKSRNNAKYGNAITECQREPQYVAAFPA